MDIKPGTTVKSQSPGGPEAENTSQRDGKLMRVFYTGRASRNSQDRTSIEVGTTP